MKLLPRLWRLLLAVGTIIPTHAAIITGAATEIGPDVVHPNGNVYDQVLLTGPTATIQPDPGQIARTSFLDLNGDIVQVEMGGAGYVMIELGSASGPVLAEKYNQTDVLYMKGHADIAVVGANATTNISIFAIGRSTAVRQSLFRADELYDGIADIKVLRIVADPAASPNGIQFGSIFCGNVRFSGGSSGAVGISANTVHVQGAVRIHDLTTWGDATPVLSFGPSSRFGAVDVAGGDLVQLNGRAIVTFGYLFSFSLQPGTTANGLALPAKVPRAQRVYSNGQTETIPQLPPLPPGVQP